MVAHCEVFSAGKSIRLSLINKNFLNVKSKMDVEGEEDELWLSNSTAIPIWMFSNFDVDCIR